MKTNTSKERNFYTQGQQVAARILFIVWLFASGSPDSLLAIPKREMTPAPTTSPDDPALASAPPTPLPGGALELPPDAPGVFWGDTVASSPAIGAALQQRMSQEAALFRERDLLSTSLKVTPVSENLSFQARGGESVRFHYQQGQWHAEVSSHIGAFSRRAVLPVVCSRGEDVASNLEVLSKYPLWYSQRQIHVLDRNVCPTLGEVVYVGELGLRGGGEGESSGSGEPQGEDPAEQGDGGQTEQAVSSQARGKQLASGDVNEPNLLTSSASRVPGTSRALSLDVTRSAELATNQASSQLPSAQVEAQRLRKEIAELYLTFSEASEANALLMIDRLLHPLGSLLELEVFWSEDSLGKACAQDYLIKLREGTKSRKLALNQSRDQQLIMLLERSYSGSLKQLASATAGSQKIQLLKALEKLAALSFDQGAMTQDLSHYTDAAILYQHMLSICAKEKGTLNSEEVLALEESAYQGLAQLQASMLAQAIGADAAATPPEDVATLQKRIAEDRNELEAFRADVKPRTTALINNLEDVLSDQGSSDAAIKQAEEAYIQGSQALFGEIAQWVSALLAKLYQESEAALGPAPCKYAVMGLGSMALQQITPYSDLEFAILMEDAPDEARAEEWRKYFRKLTHLVHLCVINLGETALPYSQYEQYENKLSLDHLGKRGITFDLGGKTPLGRKDKSHLKKPYELIQPVAGMVHYLHNEEDKMEDMDKLLPYILESTCYVHGDNRLHERYVAAKRAFLLESKDSLGRPEYQARSLKKLLEGVVEMDYSNPAQSKPGRRLVGELEDFAPKFGLDDAGRLYDVKQEIYRLPDRLLYRLAMYYGILPTSGWDAVDQLSQRGIIGVGEDAQQAAHHLQYAVSFATMLRLQTYLHYGQQQEGATMLSDVSQEEEVKKVVQKAFTLPESSLQAGGSLFKYYYAALPLHSKMQEFFKGAHQEGPFFQAEPFYDSSAESRAAIHQRMLQHKERKNCYEEVLADQEQRYDPNHPEIARTVNNLGNAWSDLGDTRQAVSFYERALSIREQVYKEDPNHPDIAKAFNNLGNAWRDLGDGRQAVNFYQRTLAIFKQVYKEGPNHPYIAHALNALGLAWRDLGDAGKAVSFYQRALEMYGQVYKETPNHSHIANALNNLGNAWCALGDAGKAVSFYQRALESWEQVYGPNHSHIAHALNNLGLVWSDLGDAKQAVNYHQSALKIYEQVYQKTPNHPDIARTLNNLGNAWRDLGDARQAKDYYQQALAIYEQVYKEKQNHPDIAKILNNLGNAWKDLGEARQSVSFYERTLAIYEQVYHETPNHPEIASTLNNLGEVWRGLGEARKAVSFLEHTLAIYEQVYHETPNHPEIARTLNNLGEVWRGLGEARKAVSFLERALAIYEQVYHETPNHPEIARTLNNLGNAWSDLGDAKQAVSFYQRALAIYEQSYQETPNHPEIARTLNNLGNAWSDLGDAKQAVSFYQRALAIKEQVYQEDPNHPDIASTLNNLGNAWSDLGDAKQAVSFLERALAIYEQVYHETPNHPDIARTLNNLGEVWRGLGEARKAVSFLERASAIYKQSYQETPNHPHIARSLHNLGAAWRDLGEARKAVSFYERALAIYEQVYQETPNHPDIARTLNNLGNAWDGRQAVSYYQRALAIYEQVYHETPNHPDIARTLNNLGNAYSALGDYSKALEYYQQALEMQQALHEGKNHAQVAQALRDVGDAYKGLSQHEQALEYYQPVLTMQQKLHEGNNHADVAGALNDVGVAYQNLEKYTEALEYFQQALKMHQEVHKKKNHTDIAINLRNVGIAYQNLGNYTEALEYYQQALKMRKALHEGENHAQVAQALRSVGVAYKNLGNHAQALEYFKQALQMQQALHEGENHADVAGDLNSVGVAYQNLGKHTEALEYFKQALQMHQEVHEKKDHADVARNLRNVAIAYDRLGKYTEALEYFKQALQKCTRRSTRERTMLM